MTHALIRPAWTPVTIAAMVLGFIIAWPLGLAMLAYILWGDRLEMFKQDVNRATDAFSDKFRGCSRKARHARRGYTGSGNVAFDDWREAELARLDEERRNLETMRREFEEYSRELRRAKDQDEFERFMNRSRTRDNDDGDSKKTTKPVKKSGGGNTIPGV